jgi:hypothetical protein
MRRQLIILLLSAPFVAQAGLFDQIDSRKRAEVNGKSVEKTTVPVKSVTHPKRESLPKSSLTDQSAKPGKTLDQYPTVEINRLDRQAVQRGEIITTTRVPHSNFTPKHGVVPHNLVPAKVAPRVSADIERRVIHTGSPAGQVELKEQLRKPH